MPCPQPLGSLYSLCGHDSTLLGCFSLPTASPCGSLSEACPRLLEAALPASTEGGECPDPRTDTRGDIQIPTLCPRCEVHCPQSSPRHFVWFGSLFGFLPSIPCPSSPVPYQIIPGNAPCCSPTGEKSHFHANPHLRVCSGRTPRTPKIVANKIGTKTQISASHDQCADLASLGLFSLGNK